MKSIMAKVLMLINKVLDNAYPEPDDVIVKNTECDDDPEILKQKIKIELDYLKSLAFAFSGYEQFNETDDLKFTQETLSKINRAAAEIIRSAHDKEKGAQA